jgi:hypothetical protein
MQSLGSDVMGDAIFLCICMHMTYLSIALFPENGFNCAGVMKLLISSVTFTNLISGVNKSETINLSNDNASWCVVTLSY